jgi:16S rRNA (adenine1518-N6/adenine1519-N6)-dimethyltransferase
MLSETLRILKQNGIKLDKRKGQNYLVNPDVLSKIIQRSELSKNDSVLEIGAGIGTLTIPLAKNAGKVYAVEQDRKVANVLRKRLEQLELDNVEVIVEDATKMDLPSVNKVVSNLPYQISSPITFKILENPFEMAVLMYQKEFAQRMVALPGDRNYSRLSVMMYLYSEVEILFQVSENDFFPKPKVASAVIKMQPKIDVDIDPFFVDVTRAMFQHKKKKIRNALIDSYHEIGDMDKSELKTIISQLDQTMMNDRVFKMSPEDLLKISGDIKNLVYHMFT